MVKFQGSLGPGISRERNESSIGSEGLAVLGSARSSTCVVDGDNVTMFDRNNIPVLRRLRQARLFLTNNLRTSISDFNGESN